MRIIIDINTDNAAFAEDFYGELSDALTNVAQQVKQGMTNGSVCDVNGARSTTFDVED